MSIHDPGIGDLRGRGAMQAIELVVPGTIEPDPVRTRAVLAACHAQGVLALGAGTYGNVVRLLPPLAIGDALLAEGLGRPGRRPRRVTLSHSLAAV